MIIPPALRTRKLTRLPQYASLKILAEEGGESVDTMVEWMFQELVWNDEERLAPRVPGLAEASHWPEVICETQRPSSRIDQGVIPPCRAASLMLFAVFRCSRCLA